MSFRRLSRKYLEPLSMLVMVVGIAALCQPWSLVLHRWSVTIMLAGLIGFAVFSHVQPRPEDD